jgi:hypothetical protein
MVWSDFRLHPDELLEWMEPSAGFAAFVKIAAPSRILLPIVQVLAAFGRVLALLELQEGLRHVSIASDLPALCHAVPYERMFGLRTSVSNARVGGCRLHSSGNAVSE